MIRFCDLFIDSKCFVPVSCQQDNAKKGLFAFHAPSFIHLWAKSMFSYFHKLFAVFIFTFYLFLLTACSQSESEQNSKKTQTAIPVAVSKITRGDLLRQRSFTGTLEVANQLIVAPKVSGRIERLHVDLADIVSTKQLLVELDNAEYVQALRQAEADLAVAKAKLAEAKSLLEIAERERRRLRELLDRNVSSESAYDLAVTTKLTRETQVEVSRAEEMRAQATLESARIRLGYTTIKADWQPVDSERIVAEQWVDEGDTVSANAPLLRIISLDPMVAVFFVAERDYGYIKVGQAARLSTDVYSEQVFSGEVVRVAPAFRENTRQARIELSVQNPELLLKPGMFVRIDIALEAVQDVTIVPEQAITRRADETGVFLLSEDRRRAIWTPVTLGIQQAHRIEIKQPSIQGEVVTLGQQLLEDGAAILVPETNTQSQEALP